MKPVVLITGCSSGIGRALAEEFFRRGLIVYATARKPDSIRDLSDKGMLIQELDVNDAAAGRDVLQRIENEQGKLDILVNNAGYAAFGPLVEMPVEELRRQFETNVFSIISLIQASLPLLRKSVQAKIVNIGSVSGVFPSPFAGAYSASKAGLHAMSDALRMELAPFGIQVITVRPGAIRSDFGNNARKQLAQTLKADSLYEPLREAIKARSMASQENPTPAGALASRVVQQTLQKNARPILRFGRGAIALVLLKRLLPERLLDKILMLKFKLNQLHIG